MSDSIGGARAGRWLLLAVGLAAIVGAGATTAAAPAWRYAAGERSARSQSTAFEMWWRGPTAVVREGTGRHILERRCEASTYRALDVGARTAVIRTGLTETECLRWTTGLATDAAQMAADGGLRDVIADPGSGLPLEATVEGGEVVRWSYSAIGVRGAPPPSPPTLGWYTETYRSMGSDETAETLGVRAVPPRIGAFAFDTAFEYIADGSPPVRHVLWRGPGGSSLQLVRGRGQIEADEAGLVRSASGVVFHRQVGDEYIAIRGPDRGSVEAALEALGVEAPALGRQSPGTIR